MMDYASIDPKQFQQEFCINSWNFNVGGNCCLYILCLEPRAYSLQQLFQTMFGEQDDIEFETLHHC